jgi:hypothetical protein
MSSASGDRKGKWNHDLCDCSAVSWTICCISGCWCQVRRRFAFFSFLTLALQPCQLMKVHSHVLGENPPRCCSLIPSLICAAGFTFPLLPFFHSMYVRFAVRNELGIDESDCATCCIGTFMTGGSTVQCTMTLANQRDVPAYLFMDESEGFNPLLERWEREMV